VGECRVLEEEAASVDAQLSGDLFIGTVAAMSSRLDPSRMVRVSYQIPGADRCVDVFSRPDGTFGFEEFRRDVEDMGAWTPVSYFSSQAYPTEDATLGAARAAVPWLAGVLDH
jgi:hypothetical protein